jgi:hypothetical protein
MNAMTAADFTCYPFATCNATDYFNLLGVYMDAAFFPKLTREDFLQALPPPTLRCNFPSRTRRNCSLAFSCLLA